mgnify:CR=1 FL=1
MERVCSKCAKCAELITGRTYCRPCGNQMSRDYKRRNKDKISAYNKKYKETNREDIREYNKKYNLENRESIQKRQNKQHKERRKYDDVFYFSHKLRTNLNKLLKGENKSNSALTYLGCSINMFVKWLEYQMYDDMNMKNKGDYWHLDHVIPVSKFTTSDDDIKICYHWSNMQPLKSIDNLKKGDRLTFEEYTRHKVKVIKFAEENNLAYPYIKELKVYIQ